MSLAECPSLAMRTTHLNPPVFNLGAVPTVNRDSGIEGVIEAFLSNQIPNKSTARGYRRHLRSAFGWMAVESLGEIEPVQLMNWRSCLMVDGRGVATQAQAIIAVRSFLNWAAAMDGHSLRMDQVNFLLKVPKVSVITPHQTLTDKEIPEFLAAAKGSGPRDLALVLVALGSGVRVAELVHLDIKDILTDPGDGTVIHVRQGKGSKDRMVPVRHEVRQAIDAYLSASGRSRTDRGPLFMAEDRSMSARENWRLTTRSAARIIKWCAERAGIRKRITPHALRHTFAFSSYIYCRNLVAVSKLLGHATIATTQRYVAHLDQLDLRKAIPAFLAGGKGPRVLPSSK